MAWSRGRNAGEHLPAGRERYLIEVQGTTERWSFEIIADEPDLEPWLADGLKVERLVGEIPYHGNPFLLKQ